MKNTALQQLIESLQRVQRDGVVLSGDDVLNSVIIDVQALLATERQQIEDAYSEGYATAMYEAETIRRTTSTQYFTETYKTT